MTEHDRLADFASVLGEPTRARMVAALMGGTALPATDLALLARVQPSTASEHLALLVSGGFLSMERHGRHRYYRLSSPEVADIVESIASFRPAAMPERPRSSARAHLGRGRTCYDHLAGRLGVDLTAALVDREFLVDDNGRYRLSSTRSDELRAVIGIAAPDLVGKKCLDWTERRHHCGGALGAAIARALFDAGWIAKA